MNTKIFALTPLAWACCCALAQTLPTGGSIVQGSGSIGTQVEHSWSSRPAHA